MITELINQWEANKHKLEEYFRNNKQEEYCGTYKSILQKTFELVITQADEYDSWDYENITVIDNGDYQGTQLFLIPKKTYQPTVEDYLITHNEYGSCSGCDTLLGIGFCNDDELPSEEQVKEYMTLALHIVQRLKRLSA